jgi:hypothetical protein
MVIVVQTTQYGSRDDLSAPRWPRPLQWPAWDSLPKPLMGSRVIEVFSVLLHYALQVSLTQDQETVQAFPPHTTQEPFTDRA